MVRIAIIGGGIGGLTTALTLRQFGFEPEVFEPATPVQSSAFRLPFGNKQKLDNKLDSFRCGFAAGCEARLCLAVQPLNS